MPVEVKIHDGSSGPVRVKPRDKSHPVHVDGEIDEKRLELLIEAETKERIEADKDLQFQILNKEDKVKYIEIFSDTGTFDEETLNSLTSNRLNKLVYKGVYYTLGIKVDNCWKYVCQTTDDPGVKNTVIVDTSTGD